MSQLLAAIAAFSITIASFFGSAHTESKRPAYDVVSYPIYIPTPTPTPTPTPDPYGCRHIPPDNKCDTGGGFVP